MSFCREYYTGASELYERIILRNCLIESINIYRRYNRDHVTDHQMAALMRAFLILGNPVIGGAITQEQRALLRELQDLYLLPDPAPQLADPLVRSHTGKPR